MNMIQKLKIVEFLILADVDISNGYTDEDLKNARLDYPDLFQFIINDQQPNLPEAYSRFKKLLEIQRKQLLDWEKRLKPEVYQKLSKYVEEKNQKTMEGEEPVRGQQLTNFIENIRL